MYEIRNREEKGRLVSEENSIERERMKREMWAPSHRLGDALVCSIAVAENVPVGTKSNNNIITRRRMDILRGRRIVARVSPSALAFFRGALQAGTFLCVRPIRVCFR